MTLGTQEFQDKLDKIIMAWETLRPDKTFGGMTLAQFKAKVKPSADARAALVVLTAQVTQAVNAKNDADGVSNDEMLKVVNGVKGDPDEGDDGDLYDAMGYVRKSERKAAAPRVKKGT